MIIKQTKNFKNLPYNISVLTVVLFGIITNISCGSFETYTAYTAIKIMDLIIPGDETPPEIVSMSPANNANDVMPSLSKLSISFNEPMRDKCWSISECGENVPGITGVPKYNED